jgi:hypothetical protein
MIDLFFMTKLLSSLYNLLEVIKVPVIHFSKAKFPKFSLLLSNQSFIHFHTKFFFHSPFIILVSIFNNFLPFTLKFDRVLNFYDP